MEGDDWLDFGEGVNAGLKNGPEFTLFEVFLFLSPGVDLLLEGDGGVLIDGVDFVGIGAEVGEFLAADLDDVEEAFVGFLEL